MNHVQPCRPRRLSIASQEQQSKSSWLAALMLGWTPWRIVYIWEDSRWRTGPMQKCKAMHGVQGRTVLFPSAVM